MVSMRGGGCLILKTRDAGIVDFFFKLPIIDAYLGNLETFQQASLRGHRNLYMITPKSYTQQFMLILFTQ